MRARTGARSRGELEIPLVVDRDGDTDLRQQVAEQVRDNIRSGAFPVGQRMPSSRELAGTLGVSRATVTAALTELGATENDMPLLEGTARAAAKLFGTE